jgi:hypothetical protein
LVALRRRTLRDTLEPSVIEAAAEAGHDQAELAELRRAMRALRAARDTADFYRRNLEFHAEIAALCRNDVLRTIYEALLNAVRAREPRLELLPGQDAACGQGPGTPGDHRRDRRGRCRRCSGRRRRAQAVPSWRGLPRPVSRMAARLTTLARASRSAGSANGAPTSGPLRTPPARGRPTHRWSRYADPSPHEAHWPGPTQPGEPLPAPGARRQARSPSRASPPPTAPRSAGPTRLAAASPDLLRSLVKQSSVGSSPFGRTVLTAPAARAVVGGVVSGHDRMI